MTVVFGTLCFIGGLNVGVLMSILVSEIIEKKERSKYND